MKTHEEFAALLDAFVDGELSPEEAKIVQEHLNTCPDCQAYVDDSLAIRAAFPSVEETEVPDGFAEGVMAAIRAQSTSTVFPQKKRRQPWARILLPVAACFALVLVLKTADFPMLDSKQERSQADATDPTEQRSPKSESPVPESPNDAADIMPAQMDEAAPAEPPAQGEQNTTPDVSVSAPETSAAEKFSQEQAPPSQDDRALTEPRGTCFAQMLLTAEEAGTLLDGYTPIREVDSQTTYELTVQEYQTLLDGLEQAGISPQFSMKDTGAAVSGNDVALIVVQH